MSVCSVTAGRWSSIRACSCSCWCSADSTLPPWMALPHLWALPLSCLSSSGECQCCTNTQSSFSVLTFKTFLPTLLPPQCLFPFNLSAKMVSYCPPCAFLSILSLSAEPYISSIYMTKRMLKQPSNFFQIWSDLWGLKKNVIFPLKYFQNDSIPVCKFTWYWI